MDLKHENSALNKMPILYINNKQNHNMKTLKEMDQIEAMTWLKIQDIPPLQGYTTQEAHEMTDLVRTFIDPKQRSCAHCGTTGNLRDAKNKFTKFYLDHKEIIESIAFQYHINKEGVKPLSYFFPEDETETIFNEINSEEIITKIEDQVFGEFKEVKKRNKKK